MNIYIFLYFLLGVIIGQNYVAAQACESDSCIVHAEDIAHRMWFLADVRTNVFSKIAFQIAKTKHYQLALWHMNVLSKMEKHDSQEVCLSNHNISMPDITQVYLNEIRYVVDEYIYTKPKKSDYKELGFVEPEDIMDNLWDQICGGKMAITQRLLASILKKQVHDSTHDHIIMQQLEIITNHLYNRVIPSERWRSIVHLTYSSLCNSDFCPWLHRVIEQIEHYLIEQNEEFKYDTQISHLVRGYCHEQINEIIEGIIGHNHDCEGSLQFVPFDHEIYLAIPRPTDTIDKHYYDTPGSILLDVGINHPLYNEISALKDIFNQVDKKRIVEKFGKVELPKKLKFMKFLLHDEDVQKELNNNKNLKDTADIILLLMNLTSESIFGPNFVTDAHDFINLIDFIPDPDNDVETYNVELLYDLLADPEELNNLFDVESLVDNSLSEQELLIEIINSLLVNSTSSKYTFTDGLITILDKLIDNSNKAYHTMDDTSDAYAAHSIRPHDTLVVEVDPSRLDRKPRFTHPDHYSNETDRPKSTYTMQCTIPSPVLTVLESDIEHLDQLIPLTPGKYIYHVGDKLIRQLKNLLKDNKLRKKILDENFDIVKYPTKVLLMEGVFEALDQLVENGIIDIDPDLQNFIDIYYYVLDFTNEELGVSPKAIMRYNYEHLLTLLPTPTESDKKKYEAIQSFLLDDDLIDYIVRNMDPIQYNKQAQILSYILNACTNSEDQEIRSACNYYLKTIKDLRSADQSLEKYVTYKKSKLNNIEITYVQLNPSNLTASSVTPTLQPEKEGILQIPIPNTKLLIDPRDMTHPEEMIPDVVPAFPLHYNLTDLQWQLRRPDASRIIMEKIDRKDKALKVETLEDVIDHLIISALSDKFHLQEHSLKFANTYCLALKVANKRITNISTKNDYVELLKKHLESTGNKKDIAKCDKLFEVLDNNDLMTRILGPIYPILRPKYYSDFYFILSVLKMIDMSRNPDVAHIKDINKKIIEVLRASLYKHDQLLIETKDVDISDALTATFNSKTFPRNLTSTYIKVSRFLMRDFDKKKHLPGFDYRDYKTKGQLIIGMFKTMISENTIPNEIKGHMKQLLPHAQLDGLAAYPI